MHDGDAGAREREVLKARRDSLERLRSSGIEPFAVLGLGGDDGPARPDENGYLVSVGFDFPPE